MLNAYSGGCDRKGSGIAAANSPTVQQSGSSLVNAVRGSFPANLTVRQSLSALRPLQQWTGEDAYPTLEGVATFELVAECQDTGARAGVPAVVLRVVSDSVDAEMPDFNRALNADGALNGPRALWIALGSPLETLRLLASNKRAMERLTPAVKLVLESDCFSRIGNAMKNN